MSIITEAVPAPKIAEIKLGSFARLLIGPVVTIPPAPLMPGSRPAIALVFTNGLGLGGDSSVIISSAVSTGAFGVSVLFSSSVIVATNALIPSNWTIIDTLGRTIAVTAVGVSGSTVTLTTAEQITGALYTLTIPSTGIFNGTTGGACVAPFTTSFTGVGLSVTILMARSIDARLIEVIFSVPVVVSDALNLANYSINNGLSVTAAFQVSPQIFRLVTTKQVSGTVYTVTASGIRDPAGTSI